MTLALALTLALLLSPSTDEGVTAGASLRVRLVVGDVLMAGHARRAVGPSPTSVNVVTRCALGMTLTLRLISNAMEAGQLRDLVAACAGGVRGCGAAVGLVA
ncbi:MAG: hypothetical protein OEM15_06360 [Myxococcales bacterium]|nr:hypothetical protein [Myxococcales bacterium]MDH3484365.1 hypothetical protein [Myxococcales bacterium]